MKRLAYLDSLKTHLRQLPEGDVADILRDQEEYIRDAVGAGRSEEDAIQSLGEPKAFAANLIAELKIQQAIQPGSLQKQMRGTIGAVCAILALAPINLIFVLGPFLALAGFLAK